MKKILTIIIPTYNMEKYLRRCLDSLIVDAEKMAQLEVLVVNDGSKDASSVIAHEYEAKYPQTFRVIDKENGNYGSCVNRGLKEANGKYVKILDADDSFDNSSFHFFLQRLPTIDADLILTDFVTVDEKGVCTGIFNYSEYKVIAGKLLNIETILQQDSHFYGQMHGFTYRLAMLLAMNYSQTEGYSYTDQEWVSIPITHVSTYYYHPVRLYKYLVGREGQTMASIHGKSMQQLMHVILILSGFVNNSTYNRRVYTHYLLRQLTMQIELIYRSGLLFRSYDCKLLSEFDDRLKQYPQIYGIGDKLSIRKVPYVTIWRRNKKKMPLYLWLILFVWRFKHL